MLGKNPILDTDSYKLSHPRMYPREVTGMSAYITARKPGETITFFGLQKWLMDQQRITPQHVDEALDFAARHGEPFDPKPWMKVIDQYDGRLPLQIWALPEGSRVPSGVPLVRIECTDEDLFWLPMHVETSLQRAVWYPTTIASNDYKNWRMLRRFLLETSDNKEHLDYMLHDFGGRGVSSEESAQLAGMAHLVYFNGSDTISGVRAANAYYDCSMAAHSVPASEHSVQCSYGRLRQPEYLAAVLKEYAKKGGIVSIVIDGYDTFREAETLCNMFRKNIVDSGAKVVFRPDSGDPVDIVPRLLRLQASSFGFTENSKGYKVIKHVGVIQGDGVDYDTMERVLEAVTKDGFSAENVVFGSGGALLQKVNRDTYGFAQKASATACYGNWTGISKDPVTDSGKKSRKGRLTTLQSDMTGEYMEYDLRCGPFDLEWKDAMPLVWDTGVLIVKHSLQDIRKRARK